MDTDLKCFFGDRILFKTRNNFQYNHHIAYLNKQKGYLLVLLLVAIRSAAKDCMNVCYEVEKYRWITVTRNIPVNRFLSF